MNPALNMLQILTNSCFNLYHNCSWHQCDLLAMVQVEAMTTVWPG